MKNLKDKIMEETSSSSASHHLLCVGEFTRKLFTVYEQYLMLLNKEGGGGTSLPASLGRSLSEVGLPSISESIGQAVLEFPEEPYDRKVLSWGDFCLIAAELFAQREESRPPNHHVNEVYFSCGHDSRSATVFLGGSCNPTVWRKEVAMPLLQKEEIKFFNPQVDEWYPELIDMEEQAKQDASLLLFVVDAQTRAISSMVEIGLLIGAGRRLVIVVDDMSIDKSTIICGESLGEEEITDLNKGRAFVRELAEMHSVVVESSVSDGTSTAVKILKRHISSDELTTKCSYLTTRQQPSSSCICSSSSSSSSSSPNVDGGRRFEKIHDRKKLIRRLLRLYRANANHHQEIVSTLKSIEDCSDPLSSSLASILLSCDNNPSHSRPSSANSSHSLSSAVDSDLDFSSVNISRVNHNPPSHDTPLNCDSTSCVDRTDNEKDCEVFCLCYSELRHHCVLKRRRGLASSLGTILNSPLQWMNEWVLPYVTLPPHVQTPPTSVSSRYDVFLGGSCGSIQWRSSIAIPLLKKNNVTFFNPLISNWDPQLLLLEDQVKNNCSMLLYIIAGETFGIASMIEAAYYIGLGKSVVLCIQDIPVRETGFATVQSMKLKETSIKDYNRGRAYLRKLAAKRCIPVYTSIEDAVTSCMCKLREEITPNSPDNGGTARGETINLRRGIKRSLSSSLKED